MKYVLYLYVNNVPVKAVSVVARTYRDKSTIDALRRHSARTEGSHKYILILPMNDLMLLRRNGFVTGLEILECSDTKAVLKAIGFDLETKLFTD